MRSVGLDLGVRKICLCEVGPDDTVVRRATVRQLGELEPFLGPDAPPARVALEACREAWHAHRVLSGWGNEVHLLDTTRVKQLLGIGQHGRKNDRIDAERIARGVARGILPEAHLLSRERQRLRHLLNARRTLVATRTPYVTVVRGLLRAEGVRLPGADPETFAAAVGAATLTGEQRALCAPHLVVLAGLGPEHAALDAQVGRQCQEDPTLTRLASVPGVGPVVAAQFVAVLDEAGRFRSAQHVASYLGLVPLERTSGQDRARLGHITKQGNAELRGLLVQAAWVLWRSRPDDPLAAWAKQVAARRGDRIAIVALARRLCGVLWAIWRDGSAYDPARVGQPGAGLGVDALTAALARAETKARRYRQKAERRRTPPAPAAPAPTRRARAPEATMA